MADDIIVSERVAALIQWANEKGQDEIRSMICNRLVMLKEECAANHGMPDSDGFRWDDALEPNEGNEQWKHGGDCNMCRRLDYCKTQCRANRLLKQFSTRFLFDAYLHEHPEEVAKEAANGLTPEQLIERLGADGSEVVEHVEPVS